MADPRDKLTDALTNVRLLRYPLGFVSSPRAHAQLTAGLDAIEADLLAALADWRVREGDAMHRRAVLRGLTASAAVVALPAMPARLDAVHVEALGLVTASHAAAYYTETPATVFALVRGHLNRLENLTSASMSTGVRYALDRLRADTAALAGWCAHDTQRHAEARAFWNLSADAARRAGDATLHALATASIAQLASHTHGGDVREAAWMLKQAAASLPDSAPDAARAWVLAQSSNEQAGEGQDYAHYEAIEGMDLALQRSDPGEPLAGFWPLFVGATARPRWRELWVARGAAYLGAPDAGAVVGDLLDEAKHPRRVGPVAHALASWHLGRGEHEDAARAALRGVGGTPYWTQAMRLLHGQMQPTPASADLAEALLSA